MKKIFLIGDPTVDWLVYYETSQLPVAKHKQTKNLENNPKAVVNKVAGGVLLLKEFLKGEQKERFDLVCCPDIKQITQNIATHTVATIKNYDIRSGGTMRIDQFLGYSYNAKFKKTAFDKSGHLQNADLVIIDDAGNELRYQDSSWAGSLSENKQPFHIIYKLNWPFAGNKLAERLNGQFSDRMIVILSADDLREYGLEISRQLSWDRTLEDFFGTFMENKGLEYVRRCRTIIIRFNLEACLVIDRIVDPGPDRRVTDALDPYFFYFPEKFEGQIAEESKGSMQGLTHAFVASLARKILSGTTYQDMPDGQNDARDINLLAAVIPSMEAAIDLLKFGYHRADDSGMVLYPVKQLFRTSNHGAEIQVAGLAGYLSQGKNPSLLGHLSQNMVSSAAFDYAKYGRADFLTRIPVFSTGKFKTYDREEIDSFRGFDKLINEYICSNAPKPLSVAVFGRPGSGKSFGVKQIAAADGLRDKITIIETNLSQLQSYADLVTVFHESRDINLSGKMPLIFFDEFDTSYNDKPLGWIKYFLAPMQDGTFKDGERVHPLGRAIFVFAGGTCDSFEEFAERKPEHAETDKALKKPDFISRLKGFINIKGIDKRGDDLLYQLRRGIVLRDIFVRNYPNLADAKGRIRIDDSLLHALLQVQEFEHGARSMETIIAMSDLVHERSFKKSNLPDERLLSLHVAASQFKKLMDERFKQLMKENKIFPPELIEPIAEEIHARWLEKEKAKGPPPKKTTLKPWAELDEGARDSNRGQAKDILRKLTALGFSVEKTSDALQPVFPFNDKQIEEMAEMEHERWNEEKIAAGWTYGKVRNDALKIHDCLLPWDELRDDIKKYDIDAVNGIPDILKGVGMVVVKVEAKQ